MNNKEKIIAEIERRIGLFKKERINTTPKSAGRLLLGGRIAALEEILVFINSLPAEELSEDFKDEFNNFCVHGDIRNPNFEGPFGYDDIRKTAIHFANWQKEQLINKACEWLKENIYNRVYKCNDGLGFPTAVFLEEFKKAMEGE